MENININFFDREDMIKCLPEFKEVYENRIIKNQEYGMRSPHLFPSWYILKKIKPKYIVESGVWKGLGTWFFEMASPESKIFSIDPNPHFREYTSEKVKYFTEDFSTIDWKLFIKDPSECLVFFDDHQNSIDRIKKCKELGFKKIIYEDNYPSIQGDCYSPKKIFSRDRWVMDFNGIREFFNPVEEDYNYILENLSIYQEMPPIFKSENTRWGDKWENPNYETPLPLLNELNKDLYPEFYLESIYYTWICYMEII